MKISAALIILVYLGSSEVSKELLKIPMLSEHYKFHKQSNKSTNFLSFLILHYYKEQNNDKDSDTDKDSRLPFKSTTTNWVFSFISDIPVSSFLNNKMTERADSLSLNTSNDQNFPLKFLSPVWRPPERFI